MTDNSEIITLLKVAIAALTSVIIALFGIGKLWLDEQRKEYLNRLKEKEDAIQAAQKKIDELYEKLLAKKNGA